MDAAAIQHGLQRGAQAIEVEAIMLHLENHHVEVGVPAGLRHLPVTVGNRGRGDKDLPID